MKNKKEIAVATLQTAAVNNSINMSLTQNDLIELALVEKLDSLDVQIQHQINLLENNGRKKQEAIDKFLQPYILKIKSSEEYKKIVSVAAVLNLEIQEDFKVNTRNYSRNDDDNTIGGYLVAPEQEVRNLDQFKYYSNNKIVWKYIPQSIIYSVQFNSKEEPENQSKIHIGISGEVKVNSAGSTKITNFIHKIKEEEIVIAKEIYNLKLEAARYKFGEKRIRANITKAALKNSKEGQGILNMLQKVTQVKFLS